MWSPLIPGALITSATARAGADSSDVRLARGSTSRVKSRLGVLDERFHLHGVLYARRGLDAGGGVNGGGTGQANGFADVVRR